MILGLAAALFDPFRSRILMSASFLMYCAVSARDLSYHKMPARVGAITSETIDISLMRIFIEGPEVSLKGSPTVSPVTDAL